MPLGFFHTMLEACTKALKIIPFSLFSENNESLNKKKYYCHLNVESRPVFRIRKCFLQIQVSVILDYESEGPNRRSIN